MVVSETSLFPAVHGLINYTKHIIEVKTTSRSKMSQTAKDQEVSVAFEEGADEHLGVRYHPVAPLVCLITDQHLVTVRNYETDRCVAMFDLFAGSQELVERREGRPFQCFEALFVDRFSLMWNTESSAVAAGIAARLKPGQESSSLLFFDRVTLVKWDYLEEKSSFVEIQGDGKASAFRAQLYDETQVVIGYEDGSIKLFDFESSVWTVTLSGGHKSAIVMLSIFARDLISKPLLVSAELSGQIFCWNIASQSLAYKFSEIVKGKSVGPI